MRWANFTKQIPILSCMHADPLSKLELLNKIEAKIEVWRAIITLNKTAGSRNPTKRGNVVWCKRKLTNYPDPQRKVHLPGHFSFLPLQNSYSLSSAHGAIGHQCRLFLPRVCSFSFFCISTFLMTSSSRAVANCDPLKITFKSTDLSVYDNLDNAFGIVSAKSWNG